MRRRRERIRELEKALDGAIRIIEDAERIIEAHSGEGSWIGTTALRELRKVAKGASGGLASTGGTP